MRVCMRVRLIAGQHKRGEHAPTDTPTKHTTTGKERNTDKAGKPEYICIFAGTEKKYKKS